MTETTLVGHLHRQVRNRPDAVAMHAFRGGRWVPITWAQLGVAVNRLAAFLLEEGIAPGDRVAILMSNRPEWHIADAAVLSVRAHPVPVDMTLGVEPVVRILCASRAPVALVDSPESRAALAAVGHRLSDLRRMVVAGGLDHPTDDRVGVPWAVALERGEAALRVRGSEVARLAAETEAGDVAAISWTSHASDAVQLTHAQVLVAIARTDGFLGAGPDARVLSHLPPAHVAGRVDTEFRGYVHGSATWFSRGAEHLVDDLRALRPTVFPAAPGVCESLAAAIRSRLDTIRGPRAPLVRWALTQGRAATAAAQAGAALTAGAARRHALAERLVLGRLRMRLGLDRARLLAGAAAPVDPAALRLLRSLGLPVLEVEGVVPGRALVTVGTRG